LLNKQLLVEVCDATKDDITYMCRVQNYFELE